MTTLLVNYSSSSESSDSESQQQERNHKRRKLAQDTAKTSHLPQEQSQSKATALPRLPSTFYALYATNVRSSTADDPSLHGGRKRQVAHKEGNWPTHIYLEWLPSEVQERWLQDILETAQEGLVTSDEDNDLNDAPWKIHSLLRSDLSVQLPLHVSLSAPMVLETEQRDTFQRSVALMIAKHGARGFATGVSEVGWVCNNDRTRWFLVLRLTRPENNDLNKLLNACNGCAVSLGLDSLYASDGPKSKDGGDQKEHDDCFHISIAWALQGPDQGRLQDMPNLEYPTTDTISFDKVMLKMGNVVHAMPLAHDDG